MTEHGYFHPDRGYWQAVSNVPQEILGTYPEGTVEVPLKPGADYEWDGSEWVSVPPAPPSVEQQQTARATAYRNEADPLFFKAQRGETTEQEWLDKIEEIRARYPYPEE